MTSAGRVEYCACQRRKMHTEFSSENLKGKDNCEDLGVDYRIILKWILNKQGVQICTGLIWFKIAISHRPL
jgi:hypothetical protein